MKIIACFASSLDGKISPPPRPGEADRYIKLGTPADIAHLKALRDQADAVVFGAGTFRAFSKPRVGSNPNHIPAHYMFTRQFNVSPEAPLFAPNIPLTLVSPEPPTEETRRGLPAHVQYFTTGFQHPMQHFREHLESQGHQTVMLEGGGILFRQFLLEKAVDELWLTITPRLIGGRDTADLLGGEALPFYDDKHFGVKTEILSLKQVEQELYLHLKLIYL